VTAVDGAASIPDPRVTAEAAVTQTDVAATQEADHANVRYRSMQLPSAPFWLTLIAVVVFATIVVATWSVVFMFAIGLGLFAILLPVVNWMTRRGVPRGLASLGVVIAMVVVAVLAGLFAISVFFNQLLPFFASIPDTLAQIQAKAGPGLASALQGLLDAIHNATANIDTTSIALGFLAGILGLVGTALALTMLPFFVFYLLIDQPRMSRVSRETIPVPWRPYVKQAAQIFVHDFANYFKAEIVVGTIQGTAVTIGTFIIGLIVGPPFEGFALLLGVIAGVMELLPQIGPIISLIPALLLALATSPLAVVLVGGFYLIVFIIEANVLVPKIEGEVISFSPATVIFLVAVGLALGGIVGGILALPVAAIIRDLFGFIFRQVEQDSIIEEPAGS
jgi:predicted PurR-regulated permease PerM